MFRIAKEHFGPEANDVIKALLAEQGYESTDGMPVSAYNVIMGRLMELAQERREGSDDGAAQAASEDAGTPAE